MEIWRDIKGYEGLYQVSNMGNVKSVSREVRQGKHGNTRVVCGAVMKPTDNGHGYLIVSLRRGNRRKNFYVHRLVAEHFVENGGGFCYVNHKDYDTQNNRFDNLEWCTQQQNIRLSAHRMRKPHRCWKQSSSGEKYIYLRNGKYRLNINGVVDKTYATLAEALLAREVVLSDEKHFAG